MNWWWLVLLAAVCLRRPAILWVQRWDFRWRVRSTPEHLVIERAPAPVIHPDPVTPVDQSCAYCGKPALFRSEVDYAWRCAHCIPCWCTYCGGRIGEHGEAAKALYRATIDSIARKHGG